MVEGALQPVPGGPDPACRDKSVNAGKISVRGVTPMGLMNLTIIDMFQARVRTSPLAWLYIEQREETRGRETGQVFGKPLRRNKIEKQIKMKISPSCTN